jgi:hypothetical protein
MRRVGASSCPLLIGALSQMSHASNQACPCTICSHTTDRLRGGVEPHNSAGADGGQRRREYRKPATCFATQSTALTMHRYYLGIIQERYLYLRIKRYLGSQARPSIDALHSPSLEQLDVEIMPPVHVDFESSMSARRLHPFLFQLR